MRAEGDCGENEGTDLGSPARLVDSKDDCAAAVRHLDISIVKDRAVKNPACRSFVVVLRALGSSAGTSDSGARPDGGPE